jgi:hypothetical protein
VVAAAPRFGLVVVDKFNVFRTLRSPDETNSELIVHADRIPALTVAPERFEPIGRRCPQIVENDCRVQVAQLAARVTLIRPAGKPLRTSPLKAASVRAFLKLLITTSMYQRMIHPSTLCISI